MKSTKMSKRNYVFYTEAFMRSLDFKRDVI